MIKKNKRIDHSWSLLKFIEYFIHFRSGSSEEHIEIQYSAMDTYRWQKEVWFASSAHPQRYVQINEVSQLFTHRKTTVNEICKPSQSG
jgi:hypothetical protein